VPDFPSPSGWPARWGSSLDILLHLLDILSNALEQLDNHVTSGVERSLTLLNQVRGDTPPTYVYVDKTRPWPSLTHCFTSAPCLRSTFRTAAFQAHPCLRRILCIFPDLLSPFRVPATKNSKTPHILVYRSIGSSHIIIDFRSYIFETCIITLGSKSFRGIFCRCMLTSLLQCLYKALGSSDSQYLIC